MKQLNFLRRIDFEEITILQTEKDGELWQFKIVKEHTRPITYLVEQTFPVFKRIGVFTGKGKFIQRAIKKELR